MHREVRFDRDQAAAGRHELEVGPDTGADLHQCSRPKALERSLFVPTSDVRDVAVEGREEPGVEPAAASAVEGATGVEMIEVVGMGSGRGHDLHHRRSATPDLGGRMEIPWRSTTGSPEFGSTR